MTTSYLGSLLVDSGRMSFAAGVALSGWRPGLSFLTMSPIVDNLKCEFGAWHVLRNRKGSWVNDVFGLIHASAIDVSAKSSFVPAHFITSFSTWGKLRAADTTHYKNKDFRNVFNIHPGKWNLIACGKEGDPVPDRMLNETRFFLIYPFAPQTEMRDVSPFQIDPTINPTRKE